MTSQPKRPSDFSVDFDQTPYAVAWETTGACALACRSCRARATLRPDSRELTTAEGRRLIDDLVQLGRPMLILTGGDPFMRRDLVDLARYAVERELEVHFSPSATALVTRDRLEQLQSAGVAMVHVGLDGREAVHDAFRGVPGSFGRTLEIIQDVRSLGLPLQIDSIVSRQTVADLPALAALLREQDIQAWNVHFLVPTGRGQRADMLGATAAEVVLQWLWALSKQVPFQIRTTAAQHYRRVVIENERRARGLLPDPPSSELYRGLTGSEDDVRESLATQQPGVNDGNGFAFVSHTGDVYPSRLLQSPVGNIRDTSIVDLYQHELLFRILRDPDRLGGKCGRCPYRRVCGGSRARAWALSGDPLAPDPTCAYDPEQGLPTLPDQSSLFGSGASRTSVMERTVLPTIR